MSIIGTTAIRREILKYMEMYVIIKKMFKNSHNDCCSALNPFSCDTQWHRVHQLLSLCSWGCTSLEKQPDWLHICFKQHGETALYGTEREGTGQHEERAQRGSCLCGPSELYHHSIHRTHSQLIQMSPYCACRL